MRFVINAFPVNSQGGGAVVKMAKWREFLIGQGHQVDWYDQWSTRIASYDVYHHFSLFRQDLPMYQFAAASQTPVVVEPMYWSCWPHVLLSGDRGFAGRCLDVARYACRRGFPSLTSEGRILRLAAAVCVNSIVEEQALRRDFRIRDNRVLVCHNGVDEVFAGATPDEFWRAHGLRDFVLVTGLVEPRKNQLGLINAMRGLDADLVVIGGTTEPHRSYYEQCRAAADHRVTFIDFLPHDSSMLRSAYASCRVLALPSWQETTGKSPLEAGLLGKNVVMTTHAPAAREYLGDAVFYAHPGSQASLRSSVQKALSAPPNEPLRDRVFNEFLWPKVFARRLAGIGSRLDCVL